MARPEPVRRAWSSVFVPVDSQFLEVHRPLATRLVSYFGGWHALTTGKGVVVGLHAHRCGQGVPPNFLRLSNWLAVALATPFLTSGRATPPAGIYDSSHIGESPIHFQMYWQNPCIPPSTRPFPILGALNEAAPHWICMDVVDHRTQGRDFLHSSIVATSRLPEPPTGLRSLDHGNSGKPLGRVLCHPRDSASGDNFFDTSGKPADLYPVFSRRHEDVDVLGHDHPGPQIDWPLWTDSLQCVDEPLARTIAR